MENGAKGCEVCVIFSNFSYLKSGNLDCFSYAMVS